MHEKEFTRLYLSLSKAAVYLRFNNYRLTLNQLLFWEGLTKNPKVAPFFPFKMLKIKYLFRSDLWVIYELSPNYDPKLKCRVISCIKRPHKRKQW